MRAHAYALPPPRWQSSNTNVKEHDAESLLVRMNKTEELGGKALGGKALGGKLNSIFW
jgi:hypothetical protein